MRNGYTCGRPYPDAIEIHGFRVALQPKADPPLAEAPSLPGMTIELCHDF